jgi:hypothetical protein
MAVIYEYPGGAPRFYVDDVIATPSLPEDPTTTLPVDDSGAPVKPELPDNEFIYEIGTGRAVFVVQSRTVYAIDSGRAVFWINEDDFDPYLHPIDVTEPHRFYFGMFDRKPGDEPLVERPPWHGAMDAQVCKIGRRAAVEAWGAWDAKKKR